MLLWVPEGTDAQYLSDLPDTIELGYLPSAKRDLPPDAARVEFLIAPWIKDPDLFADQLRQMTSLKVIQCYSAGVDRLARFIPPGVTLCNGRGLHDSAVSEWIVGAILAHYNKFAAYFRLKEEGKWDSIDTDTVEGSTVAILGYGSIGKAVASRLAPFGITIERIARTQRIAPDGAKIYGLANASDVLATTNVLVNILPLTPETKSLVNRELLAKLPDHALIINAGRGGTVDTDALIEELSSGRLFAFLDTTEPEPIPAGHRLWTTKNLSLTQHSSGNSTDYLKKVYPFIHEQLRRYVAAEPLANIVTGDY